MKEEAKNVVLIKKRHIKGEKHIASMDLRESDFSENSKVSHGGFL